MPARVVPFLLAVTARHAVAAGITASVVVAKSVWMGKLLVNAAAGLDM